MCRKNAKNTQNMCIFGKFEKMSKPAQKYEKKMCCASPPPCCVQGRIHLARFVTLVPWPSLGLPEPEAEHRRLVDDCAGPGPLRRGRGPGGTHPGPGVGAVGVIRGCEPGGGGNAELGLGTGGLFGGFGAAPPHPQGVGFREWAGGLGVAGPPPHAAEFEGSNSNHGTALDNSESTACTPQTLRSHAIFHMGADRQVQSSEEYPPGGHCCQNGLFLGQKKCVRACPGFCLSSSSYSTPGKNKGSCFC